MTDVPRRPQVIETDAPAERIDHEWESFVKRPDMREPLFGTFTLIGIGLFIVLMGFLVFQSIEWILGMIDTRPWLGWSAAAFTLLGVFFIIYAIWREIRALFDVRQLEDWQAALAPDADDMQAAREAAYGYIDLVRGPGMPVKDARSAIRGANSVEQMRNVLEATILPVLDARASQVIRAASTQAFGLSAISPSASIDALLFSFRGVRLVRQIARAYGLRPHGLATWALIKRTMSSASLVAAVDVASTVLTHAILSNPITAKIAGEAAGATVASQRMYRLGRISAAACRIFPKRS
jgi:putative membrane protein